jgi:hypothetical protein
MEHKACKKRKIILKRNKIIRIFNKSGIRAEEIFGSSEASSSDASTQTLSLSPSFPKSSQTDHLAKIDSGTGTDLSVWTLAQLEGMRERVAQGLEVDFKKFRLEENLN